MKIFAIAISVTLAFGFAAWFVWIVRTALRSGVAVIAGGKEFRRRNTPVAYWMTVSVQSCFTAMLLAVGVMRLMELWE